MNERELLEMALAGYAMEREHLERQIERVRILLALENGATLPVETLPVGPGGAEWPVRFIPRQRLGHRRSRRLSSAIRKRMAEAQRKRWARVRRERSRQESGTASSTTTERARSNQKGTR